MNLFNFPNLYNILTCQYFNFSDFSTYLYLLKVCQVSKLSQRYNIFQLTNSSDFISISKLFQFLKLFAIFLNYLNLLIFFQLFNFFHNLSFTICSAFSSRHYHCDVIFNSAFFIVVCDLLLFVFHFRVPGLLSTSSLLWCNSR